MKDTRSNEALQARRALAEKATTGPWDKHKDVYQDIEGEFQDYISIGSLETKTYVATVQDSSYMDENAAHIVANSPDVVMADIDEILRLRKEVSTLKKELDSAREVAKMAWGGEIPSPLPGHPEPSEEEMAAMFERLNCPWCGGSGHVGDCKDADQKVKKKLTQLEAEADLMATWLANAYLGRDRELLPEIGNGMSPPDPSQVREAACKAVNTPSFERLE